MFWHLYKNRIKVLLHNGYLLFWLGLFPIILGTLFNLAFSNITEKAESLDTISVVITTEQENIEDTKNLVDRNEGFAAFLDTMEEEGYFQITYAAYEEAMGIVGRDEADGALLLTETENGLDMSLVFSGRGMNETILKNIINLLERFPTQSIFINI